MIEEREKRYARPGRRDRKRNRIGLLAQMYFDIEKLRVAQQVRQSHLRLDKSPFSDDPAFELVFDRLKSAQTDIDGQMMPIVKRHPCWTEFAEHTKGVGPHLLALVMGMIRDIEPFTNVSKLWWLCGLGVDHECECGHWHASHIMHYPEETELIYRCIVRDCDCKQSDNQVCTCRHHAPFHAVSPDDPTRYICADSDCECERFVGAECVCSHDYLQHDDIEGVCQARRCGCYAFVSATCGCGHGYAPHVYDAPDEIEPYYQCGADDCECATFKQKPDSPGRAQRHEKGIVSNYDATLKMILLGRIGAQFLKNADPLAVTLYEEYRAKEEIKKAEGAHRRAIRKVVKLWVSCLWDVWRRAEDLPVTQHYAALHMQGHTDIITPQRWREFNAAAAIAKKNGSH